MPKVCGICRHEKRTEIDSLILSQQPLRTISRTYRVSEDSLFRHKHNGHILRSLVKAQQAHEISLGTNLLEQLESIQREALAILDSAKLTNDPRVALAAIREVREVISTLARITGEIKEAPTVLVQQHIVMNQDIIGGALEALITCGIIAVGPGYPQLDEGRDNGDEALD